MELPSSRFAPVLLGIADRSGLAGASRNVIRVSLLHTDCAFKEVSTSRLRPVYNRPFHNAFTILQAHVVYYPAWCTEPQPCCVLNVMRTIPSLMGSKRINESSF